MNELEEKINKYAKGNLYFSPLFKKYEDKYYIVFHLLELVEERHIKVLDRVLLFDIKTLDFVKEVKMGEERLVRNPKFSQLHNMGNYILKEFNLFKQDVAQKVKDKIDCTDKVLLLDKKVTSPKEFIDENIDEILDTIYKDLFNKVATPVTRGFNALFDQAFNETRKRYNKTKKLNDKAYKKIILYTWPDFEFLIYED